MPKLKAVQTLLDDFAGQRPLRGGSLIITVFGDSISQHGNSVWLGSIIDALEPFGLNSRLIRTAVHRLVQEGWLTATTVGRRAYYSFTDAGLRRYKKAAKRIYAARPGDWDGGWTVVIHGKLEEESRERLRKELSWLGYGVINTNLLLHPSDGRVGLYETLHDLGVAEDVVVMDALTAEISSERALQELAMASWPLRELAGRYEQFMARFRPVLRALKRVGAIPSEDGFQVRTLLVHEYRRILLRDSDLPAQLLPEHWVGSQALELVTDIYRLVGESAETYLLQSMQTAEGPLPAALPSYKLRFGGL
jgi:phenylacetic acid degradation operon negative regulatory protein